MQYCVNSAINMYILVIGDATVNDCWLARVDNNERQANDWAGIRGATVMLGSTIPFHEVLECYLL